RAAVERSERGNGAVDTRLEADDRPRVQAATRSRLRAVDETRARQHGRRDRTGTRALLRGGLLPGPGLVEDVLALSLLRMPACEARPMSCVHTIVWVTQAGLPARL